MWIMLFIAMKQAFPFLYPGLSAFLLEILWLAM